MNRFRGIAVTGLLDHLHDAASDDCSVGERSDFGKLLGVGDTEPDGHRKRRELLDALHESTGVGGDFLSRAGNAGARHRVDEPSRGFADGLKAVIRTGRRSEKNGVELMAAHDLQMMRRFLNREISDKHAINPCSLGFGGELLQSKAHDRIQIRENEQSDVWLLLPDLSC